MKEVSSYLEQCLKAAQQLDAGALENSLARATVQFGPVAAIDELAAPLIERIDDSKIPVRSRTGKISFAATWTTRVTCSTARLKERDTFCDLINDLTKQ